MFWDIAAKYYDFFEKLYNGKVYKELGDRVAEYVSESDRVLECACGTGCITKSVANKCSTIIATDYSEGMLVQAQKNCKKLGNITFEKSNIFSLSYADNTFDKVIAGNVIHLLDEPKTAMDELMRVCKPGGMLIIPTYVNICKDGNPSFIVKFLEMLGVKFKRQFSPESYKEFFQKMGYSDVSFNLVEGKMPCCIARITKN